MPEPSGSTGAQPSAGAFAASFAAKHAALDELDYRKVGNRFPIEQVGDALAAAYRIDAPAIHAAGRAEGDARFESLLTHVHRIDHIRGPQDTCRRCAALRLGLPDTPEGWRAAERRRHDD